MVTVCHFFVLEMGRIRRGRPMAWTGGGSGAVARFAK
jgi:hypothetical protein